MDGAGGDADDEDNDAAAETGLSLPVGERCGSAATANEGKTWKKVSRKNPQRDMRHGSALALVTIALEARETECERAFL